MSHAEAASPGLLVLRRVVVRDDAFSENDLTWVTSRGRLTGCRLPRAGLFGSRSPLARSGWPVAFGVCSPISHATGSRSVLSSVIFSPGGTLSSAFTRVCEPPQARSRASMAREDAPLRTRNGEISESTAPAKVFVGFRFARAPRVSLALYSSLAPGITRVTHAGLQAQKRVHARLCAVEAHAMFGRQKLPIV